MVLGPVEVGSVAHGGHCVARHDGRVIFVRHALPGELVMVEVTDTSHDRFWRGDAVEVIRPSRGRVPTRCPVAGPGLCGGCDFQHVDLAVQRRLKADVVAEQLQRLAGLSWAGEVEAPVEPSDGLGWRTRMRYQVNEHGHPGLHAHHSHRVVELPERGCPIASPRTAPVVMRSWPADAELVTAGSPGASTLIVDGRRESGPAELVEQAAGRDWRVDADGFWQVHPASADLLVGAVLAGLQPTAGERAFDLYCGVGLFAGALADAGCQVWGLEANRRAIQLARRNLADVGSRARFTADRVDRGLRHLPERTDLVVLDPPRTGAGKAVVKMVVERRPRAIAYVACDPAALARDLGTAQALGYRAVSIRAFDLFPMTHHVECVAILHPAP